MAKPNPIYLPTARKFTSTVPRVPSGKLFTSGGISARWVTTSRSHTHTSRDILQYWIHPCAIRANPTGHLHVRLTRKLPPPLTPKLLHCSVRVAGNNTRIPPSSFWRSSLGSHIWLHKLNFLGLPPNLYLLR